MSLLPQIADLYVIPALSREGDGLLVGVMLENGRIHWSPAAIAHTSSSPPQIKQILMGQSLGNLREHVDQIDCFQEDVTVTRIIQPETTKSASSGPFSRRKLISGFLAEDEPQAKEVAVVEKRPFPAPLRFAVSQVLFEAAAVESNQSLLSLLRNLYGLDSVNEPISLHVAANETNMAIVHSILSTQVASLGYSTGAQNHKAVLGANGERLQAHVRQVKSWINSTAPDATPAIHLNIQGGFTALYHNNEGKILGALYGLEQAAKPYPLVMENVVVGKETAVSKTLSTLQSYLKIRRMSVKLAAGNDLFDPETLQQMVENEVVHQIHLDIAQFGSIPQIIAFMQTCHAHNRQVIVKCDEGGVKTAVSIALATQTHALSGSPHLLFNEMLRQLT